MENNKSIASLNRHIGDSEDQEILELIPQDADLSVDCYRAIDYSQASKGLLGARLTAKEREIIELRYGLRGREYSAKEIAQIAGVSKDKVRRLQYCGLKKLRNRARRLNLTKAVI